MKTDRPTAASPSRISAWSAPALVTLGGYLALAGHRSHIYDAMTRQTAATWARFEARQL